MAKTKKLIINADDLGFSKAVNQGIFNAHKTGVVTSTTLAANMAHAEVAAEELQDYPHLGTGIHLNIVRGKPLLTKDKVSALLNKQGCFNYNLTKLIKLQLTKPANVITQIKEEYRAQIEKVLSWGILPTHLDSEQHHAAWPVLYRLIAELAQEYHIPALRLSAEPWWHYSGKFWPTCTSVALRIISSPGAKIIKQHNLSAPDYFYGGRHIGKITKDLLLNLCTQLPTGISELMTHPGAAGESELEAQSYLDPGRELEMTALTTPGLKEQIRQTGVELINFGFFKP